MLINIAGHLACLKSSVIPFTQQQEPFSPRAFNTTQTFILIKLFCPLPWDHIHRFTYHTLLIFSAMYRHILLLSLLLLFY